MKENDYYGHYKAFVKELKQNPERTLQIYCREHGVIWRRQYDWMRRNHISLKRLYRTYRKTTPAAGQDTIGGDPVEFLELIPGERTGKVKGGLSADGMAGGIRIELPSGISISLEECSVPVLTRIITGLTGKEVRGVLAR